MEQEIVANQGLIGAVVWPTYMGVATGDPGPGPVPLHEPFDDINYSRSQITWRTHADGTITGAASVFAPKGIYTYFIFCHGPIREMMIGKVLLEQPIIFDRAGIIDIDPIQNQDYLPRQSV